VPRPRGTDCATHEQAATGERRQPRAEKLLKRAERRRRGALLLDEGGADEGENPKSDSDEESKVLQHVLAESRRSEDGAGLNSGSSAAHAMNEDEATRKRSTSLPLRKPSLKHPCATGSGGQGLSSLTPFGPSLVDLQLSDHGAEVGL
jgi:hypothetical protein